MEEYGLSLKRIVDLLLRFVGYLIPLIQSLPPLGIWAALMTVPFATYLFLMFTNIPVNLPNAVSDFLQPFLIIEKVFIVIGLGILVWSIVHLRMKKEGLVTSGPYRLARHPQYLGMVLASMGLTSMSVWILSNTFGMGFLDASQTMQVWFLQLLAYIGLALVEEVYLARSQPEAFDTYKRQVSFFIPLINTRRRILDIALSIVVPAALLLALVNINVI